MYINIDRSCNQNLVKSSLLLTFFLHHIIKSRLDQFYDLIQNLVCRGIYVE